MSIKAVTCTKCGMHYNGQIYEECPYCKNSGQKKSEGKKTKRKWFSRTEQPAKDSETVIPVQISSEQKGAGVPKAADKPEVKDVVGPTVGMRNASMIQSLSSADADRTLEVPPEAQYVQNCEPTIQEVSAPVSEPAQSIQIERLGRTTAKFINMSSGNDEVIYPAVGWLVSVKGVYYGKSFPLRSGNNSIGRAQELDVPLLKEQSVSAAAVLRISYDPKKRKFMAIPGGDGHSMPYVNGDALYERVELKGFEQIELGDTEDNMYVFVPLCGDRFAWEDYPAENR